MSIVEWLAIDDLVKNVIYIMALKEEVSMIKEAIAKEDGYNLFFPK